MHTEAALSILTSWKASRFRLECSEFWPQGCGLETPCPKDKRGAFSSYFLPLSLPEKEKGLESRKPFRSQSLLCWLPLLAPTPTQKLQACSLAAPMMGTVGPSLGLQGPRQPTTLCQYSTSSERSLRVCASPTAPHLPAGPSLPGSQLRALITHDPYAEALTGLWPLENELLLGKSGQGAGGRSLGPED